MADADEATSALIAQMLAQDYEQQAAWGGAYDDDEDDWGYGKKRKKKGRKKAAPKPKKPKKEKKPKVPKVKKPKKVHDDPRRKTGKWSEEEEKLFLEALELYGREWHKCVEHMNYSRDRGGFTSHAQKYFIRLYQQDKPLPLKVQESGEGYTLSGKPLDPNSAAARAYGLQGRAAMVSYRDNVKSGSSSSSSSNGTQNNQIANNNSNDNNNNNNNGTDTNSKLSKYIASGENPLKGLINVGGLKPGADVLTITYEKAVHKAALEEDGTIRFKEHTFVSPSAWAIYIIHLTKPTRKAVNGWQCVCYNDEKLSDIQARHIEQMHGSPGKKMTAREKNDMLLGLMKADGSDLGQKTDGAPRFVKILTEEQKEAIAKARQAEADAKAARQKAKEDARIKKLAERREKELEREKKRQARMEKQFARDAAERLKRAAMYGNDGRTDYSRKRSRRKTSSRFKGDSDTTLQFVNCGDYGYGDHKGVRQPFGIDVSIEATLLVDLHAHLTTREVIGYLVGTWDPIHSKIIVKDAYPGRSIAEDGGAFTEAEMDPVAEVELRTKVADAGLSVVGWYHSHPTFKPIPSMVDIANQCNYQHLFHDSVHNVDPFIGMIVGPYDTQMPSPVSRITWYYADSPMTQRNPMSLEVRSVNTIEKSFDTVLEKMETLVKEYATFDALVDFNKIWRDTGTVGNSSSKKGISFLDVLLVSLAERVRNVQQQLKLKDEFTTNFLSRVEKLVRANLMGGDTGSSSANQA